MSQFILIQTLQKVDINSQKTLMVINKDHIVRSYRVSNEISAMIITKDLNLIYVPYDIVSLHDILNG